MKFKNAQFEVVDGDVEFHDGNYKFEEVNELWGGSFAGSRVLKGGESEGEILAYEVE